MDYARLVAAYRNWCNPKPWAYIFQSTAGALEGCIRSLVRSRKFNRSKDMQEAVDSLFDLLLTQRCYRLDAILSAPPLFRCYADIVILKNELKKRPNNEVLRRKLNNLYRLAFGKQAIEAHIQMLTIDGMSTNDKIG